MPPLGRRVVRGAMVGGAAYYGGKKRTESKYRESEQEARIAELEAQQAAGQQPAQQQAGPSMEEKTEQLTQLKGLLDSGALTQEEFDQQKQKILNS